MRNCHLCALNRGLQNLETPCTGRRDVTFCVVQKVTQKAHGTPSCDLGSKLYRLYFFVTFPALVPTPAYGATRFFGCFEPVRKGCCTSDARPLFFENGMSYCKLIGASRIRKGQLLVILVAVGICFCGMRIEISKYAKVFASF